MRALTFHGDCSTSRLEEGLTGSAEDLEQQARRRNPVAGTALTSPWLREVKGTTAAVLVEWWRAKMSDGQESDCHIFIGALIQR